jgi:hypothetical protein
MRTYVRTIRRILPSVSLGSYQKPGEYIFGLILTILIILAALHSIFGAWLIWAFARCGNARGTKQLFRNASQTGRQSTCPTCRMTPIFTASLARWMQLPARSDAQGGRGNPSVSVCKKLTSAFSSSSVRPRCPTLLVRIHIVGRFRCGPLGRRFAGIIGLAPRQHVARIVEMHDRFEALEVSVVPVVLHKVRTRPLVHVTQRRHLKSRFVVRRQFEPSRIHSRGLSASTASYFEVKVVTSAEAP